MFEISRLAVFEKLLRRVSYLHLHLQCIADSGAETSLALEDIQNRTEQSDVSELSKVVKIGIRSIFELIKGSKTEYPDLCVRAVTSLFTILEGLRLEALCDEPSDIVGDIFNVLLNVVDECLNEEIVERSPDVKRLIEISSACLLSFAIIRGDTGKMLRAISAILISKYSLSHSMVLPNAVIELQKSVQSVITGKLKHPNWFTHGVLKSSCISSFLLLFTADDSKLSLKIKNLACDGYYLYIYTSYGLYKIGTGYNSTIPRNVYAHNPAFFGQENGWIFYMKDSLYFMLMKQKGSNELYVVNENNLELQQMIRIDSNVSIFTKGLVFVDGDYLCSLSSPKEDELVIRSMEIVENNLTLVQEELRFQLSEKYFKLFGSSCGSEEKLLSGRCVGVNEELISFASGKEFSLLQTSDGKVLYNSKLGNQNLRAPGTRSNQCWVELICPKMSTVKQCVIGNDGSIGLLVYNDGSVYFIGFARRGEDGENGAVRRQCNQIKPRKMTRMEGKNVVYAACNHGSTALVTDKGELFMFGKDAIHCDPGTGYVSDLKHVRVRSVALGKVHVVVLTDKGHVYTFGYNGRGQCGRFSSSEGPGRSEAYMEVYVEDDENSASSDDTYSDVICLKGTHIFKQDKCMICPICHQCTGYGAGCLASNEGDREPGEECGCGDGDSGCAKCCICKICAFEEDPDQELDDENEPDDIIRINLFGAVYERNERKVRAELFKKDEEPVAGPSGEGRIKSVEMINNSNGGKDSMSMVYLLPAKVHFRTTAPAVQIAAGLYHTVVLMENGEVYTFGSNTSGQLGINDENHIGPVKANLPPVVVEIAAGSNHTVALTATGEVFTFGNNSKNQLGRNCVTFIQTEGLLWHSTPQLIPNIGSQYAQKVTGIGASGDMTYLKISESLLSRSTLNNSKFVADKNNILMVPVDVENDEQKTFECVVIEKKSGNFRNFANSDQVNFNNAAVCYDSLYNVLWCIHENEPCSTEKGPIAKCYNVVASDVHEDFCSPNILDCELAVPVVTMHIIPCYQAAIHVLACLDMLAQARSRKDSFKSLFMEQKRVINTKSLRKEDFIAVNRFQGLGNSWTYNAHNAVEAIRFSCDTDVLLGGIGLYGGRGHYHVRLKLLDIGYESDPEPKDGQVIISTDEIVYECSLKQTYPFMFEEPVLLQANRWYIIWAQIKGSPSDCGSSGLPYLVTDDEVVFHFKSSLLSNNGTNVSSGQIPQLFYKVLLPEFYVVTNLENPPPAVIHILSRKFSHTVTEDGFKSLIILLSWCWEEFKMKYSEISNLRYSPSLLEVIRQFDKLVYINQACQHLIRAFIFEMYPDGCRVKERRSRMSYVMAELIGDVRELLQNILSDPFLFEHFIPKKVEDGSCNIFYKLVKHIIKECSSTFVACFYVFYPTPTQKWIYLSYLLSFEPENKFEHDFLITATLSALCASNICLKLIFPILLGGFDPNQLFQENKNTNLASNFYNYNPILAEVMMKRTEGEIIIDISSWLYVMGKLLEMASKPVEEALHGVRNYHHSKIALNSCQILSKLVAELSADAVGINDEVQRRKDQMLHTTPIRFRRVNANKSWNTGNGSPDAICFTVDKPGVVIVGVAAFGGSGNYDYEIELLDEVAAKGKNNSDYNLSNPHANWRCIALSRGSFGSSDYSGKDIVELNFEYPTAVQENTKYIIKLRLRGNRTNNGELGQAVVNGPDDTVFNFISTEISFNGTSVSRGQLPYIIYYRYPQRTTQELRQKKFVENQAYEAIVTISNRIFSEITSILTLANESPDYKEVVDILVGAPIVTALLPLLVTHLSPLVATNAKIACHVLKLIEELLPLVCQINKKIIANTKESTSGAESSSTINFASNFVTTSPHYSLVESDHPYKRATVSKYIVKFPESVLWLSLEFDPRCGTAQEEDVLKIYVPDFSTKDHNNKTRKVYRPLPRTYGNDKHAWPGTAIILPGNEVIFSLESASKYLSRDRGTTFGFRCLVIGFEMVNIDGIPRLELELTNLACRCASYLIKKNFVCSDDNADAINLELAEAEYGAHCSVLNRGIDLYRKGIFEYDKSSSFTSY